VSICNRSDAKLVHSSRNHAFWGGIKFDVLVRSRPTPWT